MGRYEDLVDLVRENGLDDVADGLDEFRATRLREEAGKARSLAEENAKLKGQIEELVMLPKKEQAFKDAGVDFEALKPAEKRLIRSIQPEGELSQEWVEKTIEEFQLPMAERSRDVDEVGAAGVVSAARGAPVGGARRSTTIRPEDVGEWSMEKRLRFMDKYPEAWEQLSRGAEVTGITV